MNFLSPFIEPPAPGEAAPAPSAVAIKLFGAVPQLKDSFPGLAERQRYCDVLLRTLGPDPRQHVMVADAASFKAVAAALPNDYQCGIPHAMRSDATNLLTRYVDKLLPTATLRDEVQPEYVQSLLQCAARHVMTTELLRLLSAGYEAPSEVVSSATAASTAAAGQWRELQTEASMPLGQQSRREQSEMQRFIDWALQHDVSFLAFAADNGYLLTSQERCVLQQTNMLSPLCEAHRPASHVQLTYLWSHLHEARCNYYTPRLITDLCGSSNCISEILLPVLVPPLMRTALKDFGGFQVKVTLTRDEDRDLIRELRLNEVSDVEQKLPVRVDKPLLRHVSADLLLAVLEAALRAHFNDAAAAAEAAAAATGAVRHSSGKSRGAGGRLTHSFSRAADLQQEHYDVPRVADAAWAAVIALVSDAEVMQRLTHPDHALTWRSLLRTCVKVKLRGLGAVADAAAVRAAAAAGHRRTPGFVRLLQEADERQQQACGTAAGTVAAAAPPAEVRLPEAPLTRFGCWSYASCTNMHGASEATLKLLTCSGCNVARYCCAGCSKTDWQREHKARCGELKRSMMAAAAAAAQPADTTATSASAAK